MAAMLGPPLTASSPYRQVVVELKDLLVLPVSDADRASDATRTHVMGGVTIVFASTVGQTERGLKQMLEFCEDGVIGFNVEYQCTDGDWHVAIVSLAVTAASAGQRHASASSKPAVDQLGGELFVLVVQVSCKKIPRIVLELFSQPWISLITLDRGAGGRRSLKLLLDEQCSSCGLPGIGALRQRHCSLIALTDDVIERLTKALFGPGWRQRVVDETSWADHKLDLNQILFAAEKAMVLKLGHNSFVAGDNLASIPDLFWPAACTAAFLSMDHGLHENPHYRVPLQLLQQQNHPQQRNPDMHPVASGAGIPTEIAFAAASNSVLTRDSDAWPDGHVSDDTTAVSSWKSASHALATGRALAAAYQLHDPIVPEAAHHALPQPTRHKRRVNPEQDSARVRTAAYPRPQAQKHGLPAHAAGAHGVPHAAGLHLAPNANTYQLGRNVSGWKQDADAPATRQHACAADMPRHGQVERGHREADTHDWRRDCDCERGQGCARQHDQNLAKDRERHNDRDPDRDRERERGSHRIRDGQRDGDRERERGARHRDRDRERDRSVVRECERSMDRNRHQDRNRRGEQERVRHRDWDREWDRDRTRASERERGRPHDRDVYQKKDQEQEHEGHKNRHRDRDRSGEQEREHHRYRDQDKDGKQERARHRDWDSDNARDGERECVRQRVQDWYRERGCAQEHEHHRGRDSRREQDRGRDHAHDRDRNIGRERSPRGRRLEVATRNRARSPAYFVSLARHRRPDPSASRDFSVHITRFNPHPKDERTIADLRAGLSRCGEITGIVVHHPCCGQKQEHYAVVGFLTARAMYKALDLNNSNMAGGKVRIEKRSGARQ